MLSEINGCVDRELIFHLLEGPLDSYLQQLDALVLDLERDDDRTEEKDTALQRLNDSFLKTAEECLNGFQDKRNTRVFLKYFRETRPEYYYSSEIMDKGYKKYRGYPGDFEMMHYVYGNQPCSRSLLGRYFDVYFLNNAYAVAVRGRKNKMVAILRATLEGHAGKSLRILNLPCGPARDVQEFVGSPGLRTDVAVEIVCVDQDLEALEYARAAIKDIPSNIKIIFQQGDILNYIRRPDEYTEALGTFDFVYSIGLADYLKDKLLENMIDFSWKLVSPEGKMTYAFKIEDRDPFAPVPPKFFCDWHFVSRGLDEAWKIVKASLPEVSVFDAEEWEESGRIAFLTGRRARMADPNAKEAGE
jgi:hypothetical protein